jgi:membrane protease YdiL (CAAX protease family)
MAEPLSNTGLTSLEAESYWQESRGPLASLLFMTPLLLLYEGGVLVFGSGGVRNGADAWLRSLLDTLGFSGYFLLPVLTVGILLAWHHTTRKPWRVHGWVLSAMLVESAVLGLLLVGIAHLQGKLFEPILSAEMPKENALTTVAIVNNSIGQTAARLIGFFGAGIYEEVLFRLLLLPVVAALLGAAGLSPMKRAWGAIAITSLIFSTAHYIGPYGDVLQLYTFTFRFLAGMLFALLFVYRGFGIAAGTHALYDIFVGLFP